ncbi:MAG: magnesium chelatase ATPase subunit D, partial [Paracoccaceae bacterium]
MSAPAWSDAVLAAALVAVDPHGLGGLTLRARHGPVRTRWLETLAALLPEGVTLRKLPPEAPAARLVGGLDLAASLPARRPVAATGLLAEADGGLLLAPMAERMADQTAGLLAAALDRGRIAVERDGLSLETPARFGLIALDERAEDDADGPPPALADRLAFALDLTEVGLRETAPAPFDAARIAAARDRHGRIALAPETLDAVTATAAACAIPSLRAPILAVRAAQALLALFPDELAEDAAAERAAALVLAPRARRLPETETETEAPEDSSAEPPSPPPEDPGEAEREPDGEALADRVLEAVTAA